MKAHNVAIDQIFVTGGGAQNDLWMQIVADVTGQEISLPYLLSISITKINQNHMIQKIKV